MDRKGGCETAGGTKGEETGRAKSRNAAKSVLEQQCSWSGEAKMHLRVGREGKAKLSVRGLCSGGAWDSRSSGSNVHH